MAAGGFESMCSWMLEQSSVKADLTNAAGLTAAAVANPQSAAAFGNASRDVPSEPMG